MSTAAATRGPHQSASWPAHVVGCGLRLSGALRFKGKSRLIRYWLDHRNQAFVGLRRLPGGGRLVCDFSNPYEAMVWLCQEEEVELRALSTLLSPGDHFIDCGAGFGLWSLVAAARVGEAGRVTAFEPNPAAYERLLSNLAASSILGGRVTALNVAVADRSGERPFDTGAHHNLGRLAEALTADSVIVPTATLDAHLVNVPIRGIKLDIEGAEAAALRGARRLLALQRPWVCVEFNARLAGVERIGDWEVFSMLRRLDYRCRHVADRNGRTPGSPIDADDRFAGYCNVLFDPT